jgi:hypothetical protein
MKAPNCPFCDTENIALTFEPTTAWYRVRSRVLFTTGGVSLCAGLGAIVRPYIIGFTHDHFKRVAELPPRLRSDFFDALDECLDSGFFDSSSLCIFEHGGGSGSGNTACVEHCHLHIVDGGYDLRGELKAHFPKGCEVEISEHDSLDFEPGYLLAGTYTGNRVIHGLKAEKPNCGSQFFRRLLADKVGSITWNWRTHPTPEAASQLCVRWREQNRCQLQ